MVLEDVEHMFVSPCTVFRIGVIFKSYMSEFVKDEDEFVTYRVNIKASNGLICVLIL